jgi:SAM-dependent methyltransferase
MDLGCGPGGNLDISKSFHARLTVGVDVSPLALNLAQQRTNGAALVQADVSLGAPLADNSFDVTTIFNVLYHKWVQDESTVLREAWRVLRPQGLMLVTEPAFPILQREMDVAAMGQRRYTKSHMASLCRAAGFQVLASNYFTSFGFPLLLGLKGIRSLTSGARENSKQAADMVALPLSLNELMYRIARAEAVAIEHGVPIPVGSTLVCLARRLS